MKTVLVVTEEKFNLKRGTDNKILIATKVPYLFNDMKSENINIVPLEVEEEIPSQKTWDLLDEINGLFRKCVNHDRSWVYEASYHIEGSGIAQNCADIISATKVIIDILNENEVTEIIMYPTEQNVIECMLFHEIAKSYNLPVYKKFVGIKEFLVTRNLNKIVLMCKIAFYIFKACKEYIRLIRHSDRYLNSDLEEFDIGIIHASESKKSISWKEKYIYDINKEFDKCKLMCLNAPYAANYFNKRNINTDEMEKWITSASLKKRKQEYIIFLKQINKMRSGMLYSYGGMDISKTIRYFVYVHLLCTIPHNLQVDAICADYFSKNKYKVMSSQGDSNFIETKAMFFNTREENTRIFRREGLSIFNIPRYEPYQDIIQIRFFCKDACRYKELMQQGWKGNVHFIEDTMYIPKFVKNYANRVNKTYTAKEKISVIWAPSYVVKGLTTNNSFKLNNERISNWFEEKGYLLNIKFHPSQNITQIQELIEKFKNSRYVKIIDKNESFYDWMEKSEIVITDKSLCVFDGITEGKPVMVLCSPLHYRLMSQHEKGVRIYQDINTLFEELERLEEDREYFKKWRKETIDRQDKYFLEFARKKDGVNEMIEILKRECGVDIEEDNGYE